MAIITTVLSMQSDYYFRGTIETFGRQNYLFSALNENKYSVDFADWSYIENAAESQVNCFNSSTKPSSFNRSCHLANILNSSRYLRLADDFVFWCSFTSTLNEIVTESLKWRINYLYVITTSQTRFILNLCKFCVQRGLFINYF